MDRTFRRRIKEAVANPQVRLALDRATGGANLRHAASMAAIDWEGMRRRLRSIKEASIRDLPDLVRLFKEEAEGAGAVVYEATDAAAARSYTLELARKHGVKMAVKSKSMLTEEIGLNRNLEAAGVRVVETDLGEWIIQLAGERPSHFVAPAIHKTREEIARLFSQKLGQEVPPDPSTMTKLARRELRRCFIEADLGVSGANMALAETGSLVIVTNEGNGRLVSTLPPVHLAFVGYEKIIPGLPDAALVLQLLSRSSGGHKMTAYVSYITGPSRTMDIEKTLVWGVHGPEEVHVVLVDNGRLAMREDPDFREALYCIKCGGCLNACPVFQVVGGHIFGEVYHGGIGAILTAFLEGLDKAEDLTHLCVGCGKCVEVCPVMIDVPRMIQVLKERIVRGRGLPWTKSIINRRILPDRDRFRTVLAGARMLPGFVAPFPKGATLPRPAAIPFHKQRPPKLSSEATDHVALYTGCMMDLVQPEMARAVVEALGRRGVEVTYPAEEVCCGGPAIFSGDRESGLAMARRNIASLERLEAETIVTACPSCSLVLKQEYPRLFASDSEWLPRADALASRVQDFSPYLAGLKARTSFHNVALGLVPSRGVGGQTPDLHSLEAVSEPGAERSESLKVTYHDSCHLKRGLGVYSEPRQLIRDSGHELLEMTEPDHCCGYGGTYSLDQPEISAALLEKKLNAIEATGAEVVASDCPGCLLYIGSGLQKRGSNIKALHTVQLLR